jgi:hypothetical protein
VSRPPAPRDPFADDPDGPCSCGHTDCPCGRCHGDGWVEVQPQYAVQQFPDPTMEKLAQLDDAGQQRLWDHVRAMRAAAERSVYPCRACNADLFYRWAGGHLAHDHDTGRCADCIETLGVKGARSAARGRNREPVPATTPPRKDTDG